MNSSYEIDDKPCHSAPLVRLEGVTTCVDHADILAHTLPHNRTLFDRFIVVTSPEDKDTQRVCHFWGVQCVLTDTFRSRWGEFRKGSGINQGLAKLDKTDWLLHLDSDILLPPHFRTSLESADLDKTMLYGADRLEFKSYADFQMFYGDPEPSLQNVFIHTTHTGDLAKMGTRVAFKQYGGYVPIGFFQLWNAASGHLSYPEGHASAGREDVLFSAQWKRSQRSLLPEILTYHIESEASQMGVNWNGRKTRPFSYGESMNAGDRRNYSHTK